jgi:hypothetical protein
VTVYALDGLLKHSKKHGELGFKFIVDGNGRAADLAGEKLPNLKQGPGRRSTRQAHPPHRPNRKGSRRFALWKEWLAYRATHQGTRKDFIAAKKQEGQQVGEKELQRANVYYTNTQRRLAAKRALQSTPPQVKNHFVK